MKKEEAVDEKRNKKYKGLDHIWMKWEMINTIYNT